MAAPIKHGVRAFKATGQLPADCQYVRKQLGLARREIEAAVLTRHGSIDLYRAAVIDTAVKFEGICLLWSKWLTEEFDKLSVDTRLRITQAIANASRNRDETLRQLGLHLDEKTRTIDALYQDPPVVSDEPESDSTQD